MKNIAKKKKKMLGQYSQGSFPTVQLKEIWTSRYLSTNTKIRLFNSNVKSMLHVLYGADTCEYHKENPDIHQQLSENGPPNTLA
jgi:hypothetical protein